MLRRTRLVSFIFTICISALHILNSHLMTFILVVRGLSLVNLKIHWNGPNTEGKKSTWHYCLSCNVAKGKVHPWEMKAPGPRAHSATSCHIHWDSGEMWALDPGPSWVVEELVCEVARHRGCAWRTPGVEFLQDLHLPFMGFHIHLRFADGLSQ